MIVTRKKLTIQAGWPYIRGPYKRARLYIEPGCGGSSYETYQGESRASWWSGVGVLFSSLIPFRPQKNKVLKYHNIDQNRQYLRESEICCLMSDELPPVSEEWCDVWLQPRGWVTATSSYKFQRSETGHPKESYPIVTVYYLLCRIRMPSLRCVLVDLFVGLRQQKAKKKRRETGRMSTRASKCALIPPKVQFWHTLSTFGCNIGGGQSNRLHGEEFLRFGGRFF